MQMSQILRVVISPGHSHIHRNVFYLLNTSLTHLNLSDV